MKNKPLLLEFVECFKTTKNYWILPVVLLLFLIPTSWAIEIDGYTFPDYYCENGFCYVDDAKAYINVTENSKGNIDLWLMTKSYTGNVNLGFLYDRNDITPKSVKYYNPHNVLQSWYDSFTGDYLGDFLTPVTFSSLNKQVQTTTFNFDNKNTLKYITNLPVAAGVMNHLTINFDVADGVKDAKYDIVAWPSSYGLNFGQALSDNNLFLIDPYVDGSNTIDSFNRSNRALNGDTADNGNTWSCVGTSAPDILSNEARFVDSGTNPECDLDIDVVDSGEYNVSVKIKVSGSSDGNYFRMYNNSAAAHVLQVGIDSSGLRAFNGDGVGGGTWVTLAARSTGTWYNFKITNLNFTSYDFDVIVDGTLYNNGGSHFGFQTDTNAFDHLDNVGFGTTTYIDEIFVEYAAAAGPIANNFTIQANGNDDVSTINTFNATINGTLFYSTSSGTITTGLLDNATKLYNVTVEANKHFPNTHTNWNVSTNLISNLTQYPYITLFNLYNGSQIKTFNATINGTTYSTTNYTIYVPLNSSFVTYIQSSGFFSLNLTHNFTNSNDLNVTTYQSEIIFNVFEKISNNSVSPANLTIDSITYTDSQTIKINSGNYNVDFQKAGYFPLTQAFTFSSLQNATLNFTGVFDQYINITAEENLTGSPITDFNITIVALNYTFSETGPASSGYYDFAAINGTYNITISTADYADQSLIVTLNDTTQKLNITFSLFVTNSIVMYIYDEQTKELINGTEFTIELYSSGVFSKNYSTSTGFFTDSLLTPAEYTLNYKAADGSYAPRSLFFTVTNDSTQSYVVYDINSSVGQQKIIHVNDLNDIKIVGAIVRLQRFFFQTNQFETVEEGKTDDAGIVDLYVEENNNVIYRYLIIVDGSTVYTTGETTFLGTIDDETTVNVNLGSPLLQPFQNFLSISGIITYNNDTQIFDFTYVDANNQIDQACLQVQSEDLVNKSLTNLSYSCLSFTSGTLTYNLTYQNGTRYIATGYYCDTSNCWKLDDYSYIYPLTDLLTDNDTLLIAIALLLVLSLVNVFLNPILMLIVDLLVMVGAIFINVVPLLEKSIIISWIVFLIIGAWMRSRK